MIDLVPQPAILEAIQSDVADHHHFTFRLSEPLSSVPGQFVELSIPGVGAFPVSTSTWPTRDLLHLTIRRVGRVTSALYRLPVGTSVAIRGPFGRGFPLEAFGRRDVLLLAGGLGIAPLRSLLHWLLARRHEIGEIIVLYGCYSVSRILFRHELSSLAESGRIRLYFAVETPDDEMAADNVVPCYQGMVGDLLNGLEFQPDLTVAALCGPPPLYRHLLEQLRVLGIPEDRIFASLERRMKCGVGQCCHCVTAGTFVCSQGPVFSLQELRLMPGAI